ncbi:MAG: hypothetical protein HYR63_09035 [Proteobacteria bacterium]|nr:hypothetical protein [Pseudomonadota bacterium]
MAKTQTFDVHVCRQARWTIDASCDSQREAEELARKLFAKMDVEGVRVIVDTATSGGLTKEAPPVLEQIKSAAKNDKLFIADVEAVPACQAMAELYEAPSRMVIGRMFRAYLDKVNLLPIEIMHVYREMKRVMDQDTMVPSAVAKAAALQSKGGAAAESVARRNELFKWVDLVLVRARDAESRKLPSVKEHGLESAVDMMKKEIAQPELDFHVRVMLARELSNIRNLFGKLEQALTWLGACKSEYCYARLDDFLADVLGNATIIQDLLGQQPSLAQALVRLADLGHGHWEAGESKAQGAMVEQEAITKKLAEAIATGRLPNSQLALMERVRQQLLGGATLIRGGPEAEQTAFNQLLAKLVPEDGPIIGGGPMAEALTGRQARLMNKGGLQGQKDALTMMAARLGSAIRRTRYLLTLLTTPFGRETQDELVAQITGMLIRPKTVHDLIRQECPPNEKMKRITKIHAEIQRSALNEEKKAELLGKLDELLVLYLRNDKILERIDSPERPLRLRAFMLMQLCTPALLPKGNALNLARGLVVEHLKRPNFEGQIVADIADPQEKERTLRQFHGLMREAGLMGG